MGMGVLLGIPLILALSHSLAGGQPSNEEEVRAMRESELSLLAEELKESILKGNSRLFLDLIRPTSNIVTNFDVWKTREELEKEFSQEESWIYCKLFDSVCYQRLKGVSIPSLQSVLENDPTVRLESRCELFSYRDPEKEEEVELWEGHIYIIWGDSPKKYGWFSYPTFQMIYKEKQWWLVGFQDPY